MGPAAPGAGPKPLNRVCRQPILVRARRDDAVSDTLGVVLMVAMSVAMAGALYVWVFGAGSFGSDPPALSLTADGAYSATTGNKAYTVAAVAGDHAWNDLLFKLEGRLLTYDDALAGDLKFCVALDGPTCVAAGAWNSALTLVAAGHTLHVHDPDAAGKPLQVIDAKTGIMLLSVDV